MTGTIKLPIVACAIAAIMASTSVSAANAPAVSTGSTRVIYNDLDLTTARGQTRLQDRVEYAIRELCGSPTLGTIDEAEMLRQCREEARANAQPKLRAVLNAAAPQVATNR